MNQYKGTQTEQNLTEAYTIESKARNKYTFFATTAQREGYEQIADLFLKTADNEREHAEMWFSELGGIADTVQNLQSAAQDEKKEWSEMYEQFAAQAEKDGFHELAEKFKAVAQIEKTHEQRFQKLIQNIQNSEVFKKECEHTWECRACGHRLTGQDTPLTCPVCSHPQSFYQLVCENY